MTRLKAALLGLNGKGAAYLAAIRADAQFELAAVADTDPDALRRFKEESPVAAYHDYRSLIVETAGAGLDVLFVALEAFESVDYVPLAADRGIAVFHKAPFARNLREGQQVVQRFADRGCPLVVERPWRGDAAVSLGRWISERAGQVYAALAHVETTDGAGAWRGDVARAGGGVLLHGAYAAMDLLLEVLDFPESVFTRCALAGPPGTARKHDTEDAATVTLRFSQDRIACLTAIRGQEESRRKVRFFGTGGSVTVSEDGVVVRTSIASPPPQDVEVASTTIGQAIRDFGASVRSDAKFVRATGQQHLRILAVLDAAYLSARTGAPETPNQPPPLKLPS